MTFASAGKGTDVGALVDQLVEIILKSHAGDGCPLCGYGAFWGTVDTRTGKRPHDEKLARKLARRIARALPYQG